MSLITLTDMSHDSLNIHMAVICMSRDPHSAVAARLDAPGTQYELDCIRPDFLLLRVRDPADP